MYVDAGMKQVAVAKTRHTIGHGVGAAKSPTHEVSLDVYEQEFEPYYLDYMRQQYEEQFQKDGPPADMESFRKKEREQCEQYAHPVTAGKLDELAGECFGL